MKPMSVAIADGDDTTIHTRPSTQSALLVEHLVSASKATTDDAIQAVMGRLLELETQVDHLQSQLVTTQMKASTNLILRTREDEKRKIGAAVAKLTRWDGYGSSIEESTDGGWLERHEVLAAINSPEGQS